MFSSLSSFLPKVLKRRRQRHVKRSHVDSILPHPVSHPGDGNLSAQFYVNDVSVTSPKDLEPSGVSQSPPRITLCPSRDEFKDRCILSGNTSSLVDQTSHQPLSSVECVTEVLTTTSPRTYAIQDTENVVLDFSTASLADATLSNEEISTLNPTSAPSKLPSEFPFTSTLKSSAESEHGTLVTQVTFGPITNCIVSSSFDHLASIPPLEPASTSSSITEILFLFDPLYTGFQRKTSSVRQPHNLHQSGSEDKALLIPQEENIMIDCLKSNPFKDPISLTKTINLGNCRSYETLNHLDKPSAIDALKTVVAPSAAKIVTFKAPLQLTGGTLSKWAHDSVKKYEDDDTIYRKRIKEHRIVEWRRYRVQLRDFYGNRHEYLIVKLQHVRSKETHFIRLERWRRDKYVTIGGKSGRTIDWSPDLDQVTILTDWVAVDGEKDTLVDKRVFGEDGRRLNLLDLYLVARSIVQIPGNCVELAGRSSHWFAVILSNVLDQDVDQIERKYSHKRRTSTLIGWLRESSREERNYALRLIRGFRRELGVERAKYSVGAFNLITTHDLYGDNGYISSDKRQSAVD
ncbi:hypothetical protein C0993_008859 [Termitomyces sp. T159_Od127]|nr:hypothetical protein C0993_008859 [Termitomyces sp. T159_Od127]